MSRITKHVLIVLGTLLICLSDSASGQKRAIRLIDKAVEIPQPLVTQKVVKKTADTQETSNELILKKKGIEPTYAGIKKYLQDIHITEEQRKQAVALIALLGSENYQVRVDATKKLSHFPGLPFEEFENAKKNSDSETVYRIDMIARFLNVSFGKTLGAVYQVIADKKITGLMPEVIRSKPFTMDDETLTEGLLSAVVATATPEDDAQLRKLLADDNVKVKAAAIEGLYQSQKEGVLELLQQISVDSTADDFVKFKAAESLADLGHHSCLDPLVALLESPNVNVRTWAGNTLQISTGVDNGFTGYAKDDLRKASVSKWQQWLTANRDAAELRFPLSKFIEFESYLNGNTLLACGYKNKVIELNPDGKEVWSIDAQGAWAAEKLKNGNVLVACYNQNKVVEFDLKKKEVWTYPCTAPLNVRPLKNGNVLISEYSGRRVIEVNRKKEVVWSYSAAASVADAVRLPSGNTLVAAQTRIVEVDMKGKVVWEYPTSQPYGVQALKNGNILISKFTPGQVLEVNRKKEVVWQYDCKNPTDAMMLSNGNVLITENTQFIEVTRDKKVIWTRTGASCGAARR